ncbi:translocation/assembly module TamB domain-containing protein [Ferrimonas senticii]|uniref:autotransporter assembly complex protein TamB n=1 Tax=Ferrimonas senticii TaxID=394566 RepID=UPI0003F4CE2F|nr:translocation/assembly module TamB domain-containing protein [Ferrimonas senticii]
MNRWLLAPLLTLIALLLLLKLALTTATGSQATVWLVDKTLPFLQVQYVSGTLHQQITLQQFQLDLGKVQVRFAKAALTWRPWCFINGRLCAEQLIADGVDVNVQLPQRRDSQDSDAATTGSDGIPLPFVIDVDDAQLSNTRVQVGSILISAAELDTGLEFSPTALNLAAPNIHQLLVEIPVQAEATSAAPATAPASEPTTTLGPLASLPEVALPFAINVAAARVTQAQINTGSLKQSIAFAGFDGHWRRHQLQLTQLQLEHQWANLRGDYQMQFRDHYPATASLRGTIKQLPWAAQLQGLELALQISDSIGKPQLTAEFIAPWQGQLSGKLDLTDAKLPYQLALTNAALRWPLQGPIQYQAQGLNLESQGDLLAQQFDADGQLLIAGYPQTQIRARGSHQQQRFTLESFAIDGGLGQASGSGQIDLSHGVRWDGQLSSQGLDLAKLDQRLPLQLSGQARSQGHFIDANDWTVAVEQANLSGSWQQLPLALRGNGSLNSQWQLQSDGLSGEFNGTAVAINGGLQQGNWQLNGSLYSADLSPWLAELNGQLHADFSVAGNQNDPQVSIELLAEQLAYRELELASLRVSGDYLPLRQHSLNATVTTGQILVAEQPLTQVSAEVSGDINQQRLTARLGGNIDGQLALAGELQDQQHWHGQLQQLELRWQQWWLRLNQATDIKADLQRFEAIVGQHCWLTQGGSACSRGPSLLGQRGAMSWQLDVAIEQLLAPLLPQQMQIQQQVTGSLALNWSPEQHPMLTADIGDSGGSVSLQRGFGQAPANFKWLSSQLKLNLQQQQLRYQSQLRVDNQRSLQLSGLLGTNDERPLQGQLSVKQLQLAPLLVWLPQLTESELLLNGEITIGGSLKQPQLQGQLTLSDGKISTLINPTTLEQLQLSVNFNGDHGQFQGQSLVGEGLAKFSGKLYWQQLLALEAKLTGQQLDILYPPLLQAKASPTLNLIWAPTLLSITGDIGIDSGRLQVQELPKGAVSLSDDVVFIDGGIEQQRSALQRTTLDLRLALAPQMQVDALGVSGVMGGNLQVRQLPTQPVQVYGNLKLQDGQFDAYGQRLQIARGQLVFNGPPTIPNLDVEAQRQIDSEDLTVGVRLTGVPQQPKLTLFADRSMEQQEILSYLIRGQGLNADGDSSLWAAAALSVGVGTTGGLVSAIGEELGLRQVKLDAEGSGDQTQVTVSGYIGDRLFVKYGVEVFGEGLSELTVRYYLLQRLWLEAVSAVSEEDDNQSLDIYYLFEIN